MIELLHFSFTQFKQKNIAMITTILDGKKTAELVRNALLAPIAQLIQTGHTPGLAVVLVGDDPASRVYVNSKVKACEQLGIYSQKWALPTETTQAELLELIRKLNEDPRIHGILVQSPPPTHIDEAEVIRHIDPRKDVDGFHPVNVAKLVLEDPSGFVPCTPLGCMELIKNYGIPTAGKHAVVLGRSMIVGKPMASLLVSKAANATVTIAHSRTKDLAEMCRSADILVAAVGKPELVRADFIKPGAVVIDVGINRVEDATAPRGYRLVGDVDFSAVQPLCSAITPVPGGVGPMTIAMLMSNTVKACRQISAG